MLSIILFLCFCFVDAQNTAKTCYWASGASVNSTDHPEYLPCDPTPGVVTHCCRFDEACLSNGLCYGATNGVPYRGGCTDPSWPSGSICGGRNYCSAYKTWANLFPCSNGSWWCGEGSLCSDETTPYEFLKWPTAKALGFPNGTETVISSSATPVATATGSSVLASLAATSPVSVEAGTSESNCGDKVSKGVPIGVGVGIGVPLLIAVATLAFLWTREKKRNHLPMQPANTVYAHEAEAKPPYLQQPSELDSQSQPHELRS